MSNNTLFIGIDPGVMGGWAALDRNHSVVSTLSMKDSTPRDLYEWLESLLIDDISYIPVAVLEKVSSSPQMGVKSSFTFGESYGMIQGMLIPFHVPVYKVHPFKWQKALNCLTKGDKNITKRLAQDLFPSIRITHYIADALLLAEYGFRNYV